MTNPYRTAGEPRHLRGAGSSGARAGLVRALIWLLLAVGLVGNTVSSVVGAPTTVHLGFGVLTAVCVAALIAQRWWPRR